METLVGRRRFLAAAGAAALAGCLGGGGRSATDTVQASGRPPTTDADRPLPMEPSALRERAVSGGPPKDGIPAIEDPEFVGADAVSTWLDPGDPVFGLYTGETARAYPQSILVQHEICNDVVEGTPVSVTYCPLTGTAMGFERGATTFGVSGRLVNNNLIMYDRATERWWPQVLATSIPGPWNEDPEPGSLREFRLVWTTWGRWRDARPDTAVLSRDTGFARNYDDDPYGSYNPRGGYYADGKPLFEALATDERLPPKTVVIGARTAGGAVAFGKDALREAKLLEGDLGGRHALAVYDTDLDTGYVYRAPDDADLAYRDGQVVVGGEAHPPAALPLERVYAFDAMWFAWSGFYPETTLVTADG